LQLAALLKATRLPEASGKIVHAKSKFKAPPGPVQIRLPWRRKFAALRWIDAANTSLSRSLAQNFPDNLISSEIFYT
jgi:hypothetical protein